MLIFLRLMLVRRYILTDIDCSYFHKIFTLIYQRISRDLELQGYRLSL